VNGAGEMLVFSAADFEDFLQLRPDMQPVMESELKTVIRHLAANRWPFRLHATYDETITRVLNVYEEVTARSLLMVCTGSLTTAKRISDGTSSVSRRWVAAFAVQNRMAFQGEYFVGRYGRRQAERTPPIRRMLELGVPVGARHGTRLECRAITRSSPFTGWSPVTPLEV